MVCVCVCVCHGLSWDVNQYLYESLLYAPDKIVNCDENTCNSQSRALCIPGHHFCYICHKTHTHGAARNRRTTAKLLRVEGGFRRQVAPQDEWRIGYEKLLVK